ncbi:hypothetical protein PS655_04756 [Pseudomonas fluorescens]|uniref:Uncharacterized protein n=1 Tax=Pseudomonas fluorescens TaxID=294 RepID=A0A5E6WJG9_PSEFL|nr:hypothetical protein PS655_04756 [Pseudomonas fluorescens]
MQERKTVNRSMLQIAGLLFANPSNPASAALCLIFHWGFRGSKTGRCVSLCPVAGRAVTHSVTWKVLGNSVKCRTGEIDNYWLGETALRQRTTPASYKLPSRAGSLPQESAFCLKVLGQTVGASLLAKRPAQPPQNLQTQKSPARNTPDGAFFFSDLLLTQHSSSCAYQSNAAPHPDPPASRYPPTHRIPP